MAQRMKTALCALALALALLAAYVQESTWAGEPAGGRETAQPVITAFFLY